MPELTKNEASKPNAALAPLSVLVGTWKTKGTHPLFPEKIFHGRTSFAWIEGGAFLIMRSEVDEPEIPSGIAIFGSDDSGALAMLYFDERGVSRHYEVSVADNVVQWWRNDAAFTQRCTVRVASDGRTMNSSGEYSRNGAHAETDLAMTFTREG